jgi:hypothetical protein
MGGLGLIHKEKENNEGKAHKHLPNELATVEYGH